MLLDVVTGLCFSFEGPPRLEAEGKQKTPPLVRGTSNRVLLEGESVCFKSASIPRDKPLNLSGQYRD